jgi:hypothetical protein
VNHDLACGIVLCTTVIGCAHRQPVTPSAPAGGAETTAASIVPGDVSFDAIDELVKIELNRNCLGVTTARATRP